MGRRRALMAGGGFVAGAALIAACAGDDDKSTGGGGGPSGSEPSDVNSGIAFQAVDQTKQALKGGVWHTTHAPYAEPTSWDVHEFQITAMGSVPQIASLLVNMKPGLLKDPTLDVWGDLAQSWEFSPDKLSLTFKLHPEAKWHPRSPAYDGLIPDSVFERKVDSEDVLASWERMLQVGLGRADFAHSINPEAPVDSVTVPDASTVVIKMARPDVAILPTLATFNVGYFYVIPKEGKSGKIDFRKTAIGSGPFYLKDYEPSVKMVLGRNPFYEARDPLGAGRPFVDEREMIFLLDAANGLAQFQSGAIYDWPVPAEQVLGVKRATPGLNLVVGSVGNFPEKVIFGFGQDSPFRDIRMRQAFSYAIDRDLYAEVAGNVQKFRDAGIPMEVRWATMMPCSTAGFPGGTYEGYWLDPQGSDFGPNAKFFKRNLDEAKKLMSAAGHADGLEFEHTYPPSGLFGSASVTRIQLLNGLLEGSGLKPKVREVQLPQWETIYINNPNPGDFDGIITAVDSGGPDPGAYMFQHLHKLGLRFAGSNPEGFAATDPRSQEGDPFLNERIDAIRKEFDNAKRIDLSNQMQHYFAEKFYQARYPAGTNSLSLFWPILANNFVYTGDLNSGWANIWLDNTKPPGA
jgi:ABC-type transport system substrate-binding protein